MIVNRQRRVPIAIEPLQLFYERVRRELRFAPESVTIQLISDAAMASMNQTFRKKHGPTDVLSFPAKRTRPGENAKYVGDIAISPETARRNARRFSRGLGVEMRILILHGMIHLAGFDHEADQGEMDRLERQLRKRLGIDRRSLVLGVFPESKRLARGERARALLGARRKKVRALLGARRKKVRALLGARRKKVPAPRLPDGQERAGTWSAPEEIAGYG
jgi:probable rRNA maturation factor